MARVEQGEGSGIMYLSITDGSICQSSKTLKDKYQKIEITLRDGSVHTKYVRRYRELSGYLRRFSFRRNEVNGKKINSWRIVFEDADGIMCLDLPDDSAVARSVLKMLPNIDIEKEISFSAAKDKETPDKNVIFLKQGGETIKFYYTKATPNGLPQATKNKKDEWDYSAQEDFLYEKSEEFSAKLVKRYPDFSFGGSASSESPQNESKNTSQDNSDWEEEMRQLASEANPSAHIGGRLIEKGQVYLCKSGKYGGKEITIRDIKDETVVFFVKDIGQVVTFDFETFGKFLPLLEFKAPMVETASHNSDDDDLPF